MKKKLLVMALCATLTFLTFNNNIMANEDYYEPNNSPEEAFPVGFHKDYPLEASIYPKDDVDYYKLSLYQSGYVTLSLSDPEDKCYILKVFYYDLDGDYVEVSGIGNRGRDKNFATFPVTERVDYYYYVYSPEDDYSPENYIITTENIRYTEDATYEYNDSFEDAYRVEFDDCFSATISDENDVDYYKFTTNYSGEAYMSIITPGDADYRVIIYDSDRHKTIGRFNKDEDVNVDVTAGTNYNLIVYGYKDDYCSGVPYTIITGKCE